MYKTKKIILAALIVIILLSVFVGMIRNNSNNEQAAKTSISQNEKKESLSITMLDVGQGLSLLITCGEESMLYDGGGRESSSYVVTYLKNHDIDKLKYIVASHYDEDHIAGLVGVLNKYQVDTAIIPETTADTQIYESFSRQLKDKNIDTEYPAVGDSYQIGDANIVVLAPEDYHRENENNSSIVMKINLGDFSCLMTGDAEEEEEMEILSSEESITSTLFIVGHHGSSSSTSASFLDAVNPVYAFLSVGEGNTYGHPTKTTMKRLKNAGVKVFRTDQQGEVTVISDGNTWEFSTEPCDDWSYGTYEKIEEKVDRNWNENSEVNYILNQNTMKFHDPNCTSVKKMKESNKVYSDETREQLINEGYSPCGNCHP